MQRSESFAGVTHGFVPPQLYQQGARNVELGAEVWHLGPVVFVLHKSSGKNVFNFGHVGFSSPLFAQSAGVRYDIIYRWPQIRQLASVLLILH